MKFYIASTFTNHEVVSAFAAELIALGHDWTFDWTPYARKEKSAANLTAIATAERQGVRDADVLVFIAPGKNGSHVELGIAAERETPTIIIGSLAQVDPTNPFYHLSTVFHMQLPSWDVDIPTGLEPLMRFLVHGVAPVPAEPAGAER